MLATGSSGVRDSTQITAGALQPGGERIPLWRCTFSNLAVTSMSSFPAQPIVSTDSKVEARVEAILEKMTLEEKIELLSGVARGEMRGVPRLGVPPMTAADGPFGVRYFSRSTVVAGGIALAATWNTDLAQRVGVQLGRDARSRGVHFHTAPGVNIYRAPLAGRNWEYLGEDPHLASRIAVAFIKGVQSQGVASAVKHYLANNSEYARLTIDSGIDERTARELYLPAFEAAVKEADVACIIAGYNRVNGEFMTQNRHFDMDVLKKEWGFRGILMSDWYATHDTLDAANAGLDMEMPSGIFFGRDVLAPLVRQGKVPLTSIEDKVRRILRTVVRFGWADRPQLDTSISRYDVSGRTVALQAAQEAIVLLKNEGVLPFDRTQIRSIAVIGPNAYPTPHAGGGSAMGVPWHATSLLEGLSNEGVGLELTYSRGTAELWRLAAATRFTTTPSGGRAGLEVEVFANRDLSGTPTTRIDRNINQGMPLDLTPFTSGDREVEPTFLIPLQGTSTRWTGYYTPTEAGDYDLFVQIGSVGTTGYRLYIDDTLAMDHWSRKTALVEAMRAWMDVRPHKVMLEYRAETGGLVGPVPFVRLGIVRRGDWVDSRAKELAAQADAAILAVGFDATTESENSDRTFQLPPGQDELIRAICSVQKRCVVIVTSGGAVDMRGWLDRVPGLLQAWYLGQEGGTALAHVLLGSVNPSGRLPATFESRWEDNPVYDSYYPQPEATRVHYSEGVYVGYRGFDARGINPQFPFGYGLSYTTFEYQGLELASRHDSSGVLYDASFVAKNTGGRAGAFVAQLYIAPPTGSQRPPKELKGFAKVTLQAGEARKVVLPLQARAFAHYDVGSGWRVDAGRYQVLIGDSARQIALRGEITLTDSFLVDG
jgi:beta-glucosidase